jgi:ribosomal protein L40E
LHVHTVGLAVISTVELAIRLLTFLFVLVGVPLSFVLMFRFLDYIAMDDLIEEYRAGGSSPIRDRGELNAYYEAREEEATTCPRCGAANGENYTYCHTCQAKLE